MRIKHYPGKAVDANNASSEQRQTNGMGAIYEANWLRAHESMKNCFKNGYDVISTQQTPVRYHPLTTSSTSSSDGYSALSKYQITLEQMRVLDQQEGNNSLVNSIKDTNGYRPSTLRRKNRKQYPGWDDLREATENIGKIIIGNKNEVDDVNSINHYIPDPTERGRRRQLAPEDRCKVRPFSPPRELREMGVKTSKGLRRSQTVIVQPKGGPCDTLDVKDLRRKWKSKNEVNMVSRFDTLSTYKNDMKIDDDQDDEMMEDKFSNIRDMGDVSSSKNLSCDNNKLSEFEDVYLKPKSRMDSYVELEQRFSTVRPHHLSFRAKSVRLKPVPLPPIDYLDNVDNSKSSQPPSVKLDKKTEFVGSIQETNNQQKVKESNPTKESPFSVFTLKKFKTIPLAKLLRSSDQTKTLPRQKQLDISTKNVEKTNQQNTQSPSLSQSASTIVKESASTTNQNFDNNTNVSTNLNSAGSGHFHKSRRQRGSSSSSTNSIEDQFSIPRPRLIVPVHTYARKRRTGNLLKESTIDPVKNGKERLTFRKLNA